MAQAESICSGEEDGGGLGKPKSNINCSGEGWDDAEHFRLVLSTDSGLEPVHCSVQMNPIQEVRNHEQRRKFNSD